jgi:4-hydroxy-3-polyprenylbenzoate decarboxylase
MMFSKFIVVVDADVDVHNTSDVLFRMGANVDPRRDITMVDGPVDALDHAAPALCAGSKMGIDATSKIDGEGLIRPWPQILKMDEKIKAMVDANWKNYGI